MNKNEQRKLNAIVGRLFNMIGELKSINNPGYIFLKELYEEPSDVNNPGKIETTLGTQISLSALYDQIRIIANQYGNPRFKLDIEMDGEGTRIKCSLHLLYKKHKSEYENYDWIYLKENNTEEFIQVITEQMAKNFDDFLTHQSDEPEILIEAPKNEEEVPS